MNAIRSAAATGFRLQPTEESEADRKKNEQQEQRHVLTDEVHGVLRAVRDEVGHRGECAGRNLGRSRRERVLRERSGSASDERHGTGSNGADFHGKRTEVHTRRKKEEIKTGMMLAQIVNFFQTTTAPKSQSADCDFFFRRKSVSRAQGSTRSVLRVSTLRYPWTGLALSEKKRGFGVSPGNGTGCIYRRNHVSHHADRVE